LVQKSFKYVNRINEVRNCILFVQDKQQIEMDLIRKDIHFKHQQRSYTQRRTSKYAIFGEHVLIVYKYPKKYISKKKYEMPSYLAILHTA
jgi:hypothetical protein